MVRRLYVAIGIATLLVIGLVSPAAASGVTDRVKVGVPGRNDTRGFSAQLYVDVTSPPAYVTGCCTDTDSGEWNGPAYAAEQKPDLGGTADISWRVVFDRTSTSADAAARAGLIHGWPAEPAVALTVPHVIRGVRVGLIHAVAIITDAPGSNEAQIEGTLGFPLCRGLYAVADFDALKPDANGTNGVYGAYVIDGQRPSDWNHAAVDQSLRAVVLDGYLPPQKLTVTGGSHVITGRLTDCAGQPMPFATISAGGASVRTSSNGTYRLSVPRGQYTVTASAGGAKIRSATVHVH